MSELLNASKRYDYIAQQIEQLKSAGAPPHTVRTNLQKQIEAVTSLNFAYRDRAALRAYLRGVIHKFTNGEIDERTAQAAINKVLMAGQANSPEVLTLIHS